MFVGSVADMGIGMVIEKVNVILIFVVHKTSSLKELRTVSCQKIHQKKRQYVTLSTMHETLVCLSRLLSRSNQVLCTESSCDLIVCMVRLKT